MEIIKAPIYVKLTEEERKTLRDAYAILNELYDIIAENNYECVINAQMNMSYNRYDIALASNVLQMFPPAEKVEIIN